MKKSILSIVAIAFAAVSVLSSCDKNDDGFGQSAKKTTVSQSGTTTSTGSSTSTSQASATYQGKCFFIDDNMAELGTYKIQVSDGEKTSEYDLVAQGQHCQKTYKVTAGQEVKTMTATGYYLEVVQPTSKDLKFKVTYVPSEKAKSLTAKDRVDALWTSAYAKGNSSSLQFNCTFFASKGIRGDMVLEWGASKASLMESND